VRLWMLFTTCLALVFGGLQAGCPCKEGKVPKQLYKLVSLAQWEESQQSDRLVLDETDGAFIHLATEEQWPAIARKYWAGRSLVVLQVATDKLVGKLIFETNPGGSGTKYYHLYEGYVPLEAITP
jgi:uncharacterized protein (DUF952 family)